MMIIRKNIILVTLASLVLPFFLTTRVNAASVSFATTGGGKIAQGSTFKVNISVNAGSDSYNAVTSKTSFTNLTYVSSTKTGGWVGIGGSDGISVSGNQVSFTGALLGSSASGVTQIMSITFKAPNAPGNATISSSGSVALINGGSQVTGGGNTVAYTITAPLPTPIPTKSPAGNITVSSSSHPDQSLWYKSKDVTISWVKPAGVTDFSYIIDKVENTNPDDTSKGGDTTKDFHTEFTDGVNFFHIKGKNDVGWGSASHYKVQIDSTAPHAFTITSVKTKDKEEYTLYFATNDSVSGIAKYTLKIGNEDLGEQKTGYKTTKSPDGAVVVAYDNAGNFTESKLSLTPSNNSSIDAEEQASKLESLLKAKSTKSLNPIQKNAVLFLVLSVTLLIYSVTMTVLYIKRYKNFHSSKPVTPLNS